jgi:uncharacterized protein with PIN domain
MKFIADAMLGRLARWLRLLGYDTLYYPDIEDSRLLRDAREEKRILLTKDTRLVKVRGITSFMLLKENDPLHQLKKVITHYSLLNKGDISHIQPVCSRCSLCNTVLVNIAREQARAHVPEYVHDTSENFKFCPVCNKYYWKGTHQEKLRKKLEEIL